MSNISSRASLSDGRNNEKVLPQSQKLAAGHFGAKFGFASKNERAGPKMLPQVH
jgi:hypothetical protein